MQATHHHAQRLGGDFDRFVRDVQSTLARSLTPGSVLYRVQTDEDLYQVFLSSFADPAERQYHTCHCCRTFIHRYSSLVVLGEDGSVTSALWGESDGHAYGLAAQRLRRAVEHHVHVSDLFLWSEIEWGVAEAGGFSHLWARPNLAMRWASRTQTAGQAMAARREDRRTLEHALGVLPRALVERAVDMLRAGSLYRADKVLPMASFLLGAHDRTAGKKGEQRNRILWRLVGEATAGWCSPRGSVLGALVEDLQSGQSAEAVARKHNERMDPLQYQRPSAPTSAGNVAQAERLFEQLGLAPALRRRFAAADELVHLWTPRAMPEAPQSGVFGHLLSARSPVGQARLTARPVTMTFAKFRRDVLPQALGIEARVPARGAFCAFTTAVERDAAPLLQWDDEERRNPFAWYVYHEGSTAAQWGLSAGSSARVICASEMPPVWTDRTRWKDYGNSVLLVLDGARDSRNTSLALFPECLRGELHQVRRTIEAHSRSQKLEPLEDGRPHAAGLRVGDRMPVELTVRTTTGLAVYMIDRWE
jgi:hypothetical protein